MTIELWPNNEEKKSFICDCLIKYIKPENSEDNNLLDFDSGFNFLIFSNKSQSYIPFLIKNEEKPYFILNDAEIIDHELKTHEDGIGKELFVRCIIKK
jgi:hypothetical protein